jgi:hypothetical protein
VGLSKATLANEFAAYRALVGVDENGEAQQGGERRRALLHQPDASRYLALDEVLKVPERITQRLSSSGITGVLDAMASPEGMPVYDKLAAEGHLTVRVTLAQYFDTSDNRTADGRVDYDGMLARAKEIRAKYANSALIRADVVKIFADGGIEGNPFAVPPTLPDGAVLKPFLQPMFAVDPTGRATVTGYVDTAAPLCVEVREHPDNYLSAQQVGTSSRYRLPPGPVHDLLREAAGDREVILIRQAHGDSACRPHIGIARRASSMSARAARAWMALSRMMRYFYS